MDLDTFDQTRMQDLPRRFEQASTQARGSSVVRDTGSRLYTVCARLLEWALWTRVHGSGNTPLESAYRKLQELEALLDEAGQPALQVPVFAAADVVRQHGRTHVRVVYTDAFEKLAGDRGLRLATTFPVPTAQVPQTVNLSRSGPVFHYPVLVDSLLTGAFEKACTPHPS